MTRIYTKTGDDGTTGLIGGKRVAKDALRIETYGTIDELNAVLGITRGFPLPRRVDATLQTVQDDLFSLGAELANPDLADLSESALSQFSDMHISVLEREIDNYQTVLAPLSQFILPGGTQPASILHLARTVARRAERRCVALARTEKVNPRVLSYLNRLSDLCFVLARFVNQESAHQESHPTFGKR